MSVASESALDRLLSMINGFQATQVVYVIAKLGLADYLSASPLTTAELATKTNADPRNLGRMLRLAALFGLVAEKPDGRFQLAPLGEQLRSTIRTSMRPVAIQLGELHYGGWGALLHSVVTGESGFEHVYGKPLFDYLAEHPDAQTTFDAYMSANKDPFAAALSEKYDFSRFRVIVDVGGGNGSVSAAILNEEPPTRSDHLRSAASSKGGQAALKHSWASRSVPIGVWRLLPIGTEWRRHLHALQHHP
jgi:hypothetical protein